MTNPKQTPPMSTSNAIQFTGNFDALEQFVGGDAEFRQQPYPHCVVASPQGAIRLKHGDWLLKNRDGSFEVLSGRHP